MVAALAMGVRVGAAAGLGVVLALFGIKRQVTAWFCFSGFLKAEMELGLGSDAPRHWPQGTRRGRGTRAA